MKLDKDYWKIRYKNNQTGWDIGFPSTPLIRYFDQLTNKDLKILIPGCGNGYEAEYLFKNGFKNIFLLDIADEALKNFKKRVPDFPDSQLICANVFDYNENFDLIIEQTFFCALHPQQRENYASKMVDLLVPSGKLVGVLFAKEFENPGPPFGGHREKYHTLFSKYFRIKVLENCYNSINPRRGSELFFIFERLKQHYS